jgi:hypothetical protein
MKKMRPLRAEGLQGRQAQQNRQLCHDPVPPGGVPLIVEPPHEEHREPSFLAVVMCPAILRGREHAKNLERPRHGPREEASSRRHRPLDRDGRPAAMAGRSRDWA